jgi:O-acetylserine/cysteine efflux transporter
MFEMPSRDMLLAVMIAICWAFNLVVIKLAIQGISPLTFGFLRFLFVAFPLVFFIKRPNVSLTKLVVVGLVLGVAKFAFLFKGLEQGIGIGVSSLTLQTQVIFTAIISYFAFGYRLSKKEIIGITVAMLGMVIFASKNFQGASFFGFSLVLMSAITWGISNNLCKTLKGVDMLSLTVWMSLVPPIPYFLLSQVWEGTDTFFVSMQALSFKELSATSYIAYIATLFGLTGWTWLMRQHNPSKVSIYGLLIPVFSVLFGWIFFDEHLDSMDMIGCFAVFTGLVINQWPATIIRSAELKEVA